LNIRSIYPLLLTFNIGCVNLDSLGYLGNIAMLSEKIFCISVYRCRFAVFIGRSVHFFFKQQLPNPKFMENPPLTRLVVSLPASGGLVESTKHLAITDRLVYSA
jgi:hypothetical protein